MRTCSARPSSSGARRAARVLPVLSTACGVLATVILATGVVGCVERGETPIRLQSFHLSFSAARGAQPAGTPDEPRPLVSGRLCGRTACQTESRCPDGEECVGYCELSGESCEQDADCTERQACVQRCSARVYIDVEAIGNDGRHSPYTGPVHLDVTPGFLPPSQAYAQMVDGWLLDVPVFVASASGRTNLWVEHDGYLPRPAGPPLDSERKGECADGLDNDADGLVDLADSGCRAPEDDVEGPDWYGECNNGRDDDGNGLVDLADPGCQDARDDLEGPVSAASGVSPDLWFAAPDIRSVQWTSSIIHSAFEGEDVRVTEGDLVVTSVTNSGLYLTDLRFHRPTLEDGSEGYYHSVFLFTWSTPEGIVQGDVLCSFGGGVVEFQGNTQLTFPSYEPFYPRVPECDALRERLGLPEDANRNDALAALGLLVEETDDEGQPVFSLDLAALTVDITGKLEPAYRQVTREDGSVVWRPVQEFNAAVDANACALEPFESALVEIHNIEVSTTFVECDQDQNGTIDEGDESNCRNDCQDDPLCTELQSYEKYKQWAGFVDEKLKLYVNQEMLLDTLPLKIGSVGLPDEDGRCTLETFWYGEHQFRRYLCPPLHYAVVRGNLRQIYLCNKDYREGGCPLQLFSLTPTGDRDVVPVASDDQGGEG